VGIFIQITKYGIIYFVFFMRFSTDFQSIPLLVVYCSFNPSIVIAATDINVSDHLKNNISFNSGLFWVFSCLYVPKKG
jgi:hypothetical protein